MPKSLILASASPRREELLALIGLKFTVEPSLVKEPAFSGEEPAEYAKKLADLKAGDVADRYQGSSKLIIGADTIVIIDGEVLGKPADEREAESMLKKLTGRTHEVITGVAVIDADTGSREIDAGRTLVTFRAMADAEIRRYVKTGEPMDKAGAYGIQGLGAINITRIEGCYFNVVGLPLPTLAGLLKKFGITPW
ncbi:MAG: Maf family protein [Firmicutes bacterium]|nr:Maf family protein [Bacillota bacterium]